MKTILSWSSGKDSAWTLYKLKSVPDVELAGLCTSINREAGRVAMHGVRCELLEAQAAAAGLPLDIIPLPFPCSNADYESAMRNYFAELVAQGVEAIAFGDLHLEDVRQYRENTMKDSGLVPLFPVWGCDTPSLAREMIDAGLRAIISCVDPAQIAESFAGREFDSAFIDDLPATADHCGENGEFHSYVYAGPMFHQRIDVSVGDIVKRDGFVFADIAPQ